MRRESGLKVTGYLFPADTQSTMAAKWLHKLGLERPRVGFTRYFISLKDYQCLREAVPQMKVEDIAAVCYQLRSIKCPEEIWRIRAASKALKAGMDAALSVVRAGIRNGMCWLRRSMQWGKLEVRALLSGCRC